MNRQELVDKIAKAAGLNKKQAASALDAFIGSVTLSLEKGEKVSLVGFGTFKVTDRAAREGINPQTKEKIHIPATKVPTFKAGKKLKEAVK